MPELIAVGVGGMIGGGIFSVLGLAVDVSGHAAPFAFLVGTAVALAAGYSYIRLALTFRNDGASFTYLERAFPKKPMIAGIAGWTVVVGYIGTLALYAFTFGAYAAHLFGIAHLPSARMFLSMGVLVLFMGVNMLAAGIMGRAEDYVVYAKIALLSVLGAVGFFTAKVDHFTPLFNHGVSSVFLGGALIFVAFEGFQLITNGVMETRDPERNIPRGIYGSIAITSIIYFGIALVAVGNLAPGALKGAQEYALAVVAKPVLGKIGVVLVDIAAMLATSSAINGTLFGSSRLAREMAVECLAPAAFSFRNRYAAPVTAVVVITVLAGALTALGGLDVIASFSSMTFLLVSIGVCIANLKLRGRTSSKLLPVIAGLALMGTTVILLVIYEIRNEPKTLIFTIGIYLMTIVAHLVFERYRAKVRLTRKQTGS